MTHCNRRLLQPATKAWTPVTFKSREIVRGLMKAQSIKWRVSVGFERLRFAWRRICNLPLDLRNLSVNICKACQARSDSVLSEAPFSTEISFVLSYINHTINARRYCAESTKSPLETPGSWRLGESKKVFFHFFVFFLVAYSSVSLISAFCLGHLYRSFSFIYLW